MGLIIGGVSAQDLILDGSSVSLYAGGNPPIKVWPTKVWPTVVQITLGTGTEAMNQLRAALADRGLDYTTVTEIPFDIELVGTGSTSNMFRNCYALKTAPAMDTSNVTDMQRMFQDCYSLTYVPDMITSNVTYMLLMLSDCAALTDGNVRLIGKHPSVSTSLMIDGSGLTREPFYTAGGQPWPTAEVHEVSVSGKGGRNTAHSLVTVSVPAGETWSVRVQGTMQSGTPSYIPDQPQIRIGSSTSSGYQNNASVDYSGTITSANSTIALVTREESFYSTAGFTGTVTIEK